MRQADRDISHLVMKFLPFCDENQIILPENYLQSPVVHVRNRNVFVFFHIQGLPIFANTLSDFRRSARATSTANFSFR
jgi:hypothetical protein